MFYPIIHKQYKYIDNKFATSNIYHNSHLLVIEKKNKQKNKQTRNKQIQGM